MTTCVSTLISSGSQPLAPKRRRALHRALGIGPPPFGIRFRRKVLRLRHYQPRPLSVPASYASTRIGSDAPRVSIVTPSLNQGHAIRETLSSVVDQDYPNLQYIVQDGGSTDDSVAILRRYADRLDSWESLPDAGQAQAINRGLQRSTGEIMAYLNSDDLLLPGSLAYVGRYFQQHPDVDVVYGHRILIDDNSDEIGRWVLPRHDDRALLYTDYIPQETMFWRRRAWECIGGRLDESFHYAMDWDLILRFRAAGMRFVRLPRFLGAFRVSRQQKTVRAIATVGRQEVNALRQRHLGRVPSRREIRRAMQSYFRRHWICDQLYWLGLINY